MNKEQRAIWLLSQILDALPTKRDWLDPAIEAEARDVVKGSLAPAPEPSVRVFRFIPYGQGPDVAECIFCYGNNITGKMRHRDGCPAKNVQPSVKND